MLSDQSGYGGLPITVSETFYYQKRKNGPVHAKMRLRDMNLRPPDSRCSRFRSTVCATAPPPKKRTTEACARQNAATCPSCARHFGGILSDTMFWGVSSSLAAPLYLPAHPLSYIFSRVRPPILGLLHSCAQRPYRFILSGLICRVDVQMARNFCKIFSMDLIYS